jgi:hypothetical protein
LSRSKSVSTWATYLCPVGPLSVSSWEHTVPLLSIIFFVISNNRIWHIAIEFGVQADPPVTAR